MAEFIYLTTDGEGLVHRMRGNASPTATMSTVPAFTSYCADFPDTGNVVYRLVGSPSESPLIDAILSNPKIRRPVEIVSPAVWAVGRQIVQPADRLRAMRGVSALSSLGGWHAVAEYDKAVYSILAAYRGMRKPTDGESYLLLRRHPAFAQMSFFRGLDCSALLWLLCDIVDPRWWIISSRQPGVDPYETITANLYHRYGLFSKLSSADCRAVRASEAAKRRMKLVDLLTAAPAPEASAPGLLFRRIISANSSAIDDAAKLLVRVVVGVLLSCVFHKSFEWRFRLSDYTDHQPDVDAFRNWSPVTC